MGDKKGYLNELDELILLAVARLGTQAYGVTIFETLERVAERPTSIGAIYAALDRLEQKGLVSSWLGEATPERGGRAKKYFKLEGAGKQALRDAEQTRSLLRAGLNPGLQSSGGTA